MNTKGVGESGAMNPGGEKPQGRPMIDPPAGFDVIRQGANTVLLAPQVGIVLMPLSANAAAEHLLQIQAIADSPAKPVTFGQVSGHKLTVPGNVLYFLACDGGHVNVTLQASGGGFGESELEALLPTLRFE